eukprot:TRINITY_DN775_c0_g1_i3.p2 TRINITY_DN775_c0_g1~~TRINITY_DN775_c0_g1_i3.p2  ORF type:complete len:139 (-),score=35.19 TRINITY_DN775_c0_g1_i3:576-992(-)
MCVIEEQEKEADLEDEAVFAQYAAEAYRVEFGTKSAVARMIQEQEKEDDLQDKAVMAAYTAEFGTKSAVARMIRDWEVEAHCQAVAALMKELPRKTWAWIRNHPLNAVKPRAGEPRKGQKNPDWIRMLARHEPRMICV